MGNKHSSHQMFSNQGQILLVEGGGGIQDLNFFRYIIGHFMRTYENSRSKIFGYIIGHFMRTSMFLFLFFFLAFPRWLIYALRFSTNYISLSFFKEEVLIKKILFILKV